MGHRLRLVGPAATPHRRLPRLHHPERLREAHGYPEFTPAVKQKILGGNSAVLYGIGPHPLARAELEWIEEASGHLAKSLP